MQMLNLLAGSHSFRRQIISAFTLLTLVVCTFFSLAAYVAVEISEEQLVNERLVNDTNQLISRHQRKSGEVLVDEKLFINEKIPAIYRTLSDGIHEVELDGKEMTVFIRSVGTDTYAAVNDTSEFEQKETMIFTAIAIGFVVSVLVALVLGLFLSRRIVRPVEALADAIEGKEDCSNLPSMKNENEIGTLARAFSKRSVQMQQFLADEKLFTGDVSHELRTPLTIMLGAAELLEVRLANQPDNLIVAQRITRIAAEAAERVSALLLLSQSPEVLKGTSLSLSHLVLREIDRYQQLLGEKPVKIEFEPCSDDVFVITRNELAGIAIGNLIRNACQYTQQGTVRVILQANRIVVEDEGPGLPENVRIRLFSRYVRGDGEERAGSGLGLAIVKRVVDHMGWTISYEVANMGGSRFILEFPQVSDIDYLH